MTAEFSLLFVLAAILLTVPVIWQLRGLGARIEVLRHELDTAPLARELRYTIREVVVATKSADVVAFPQRTLPPAGSPGHWRKAA
jgi:hypothetical protein